MEQRKSQNSGKKSFFDGAFGKYLVPGILLQSVLIGEDMQLVVKLYLMEQCTELKVG